MSKEYEVIKNTKYPNTRESLREDLHKLGVREGDTLLVHASLSSIGWVAGGQLTVCEALFDAVGMSGTLVMPAHTPGNSDPAEWEAPPIPEEWHDTARAALPPFDKDKFPAEGMGAIAECFRHYPGTRRSSHPQTSFCASGKNAAYITENHVLTPQFGDDSPVGKCLKLDAKVLLLGVGYNRCSCLHYAETMLAKEKVRLGASVLENGKAVWKYFYDTDFDEDRFPAIGHAWEAEGAPVSIGLIGQAECRLFPMREAVKYAYQHL